MWIVGYREASGCFASESLMVIAPDAGGQRERMDRACLVKCEETVDRRFVAVRLIVFPLGTERDAVVVVDPERTLVAISQAGAFTRNTR